MRVTQLLMDGSTDGHRELCKYDARQKLKLEQICISAALDVITFIYIHMYKFILIFAPLHKTSVETIALHV